ncbi:MAG: ankyrin repeat domain-containing protein [Desulfococcaceae bacterium]
MKIDFCKRSNVFARDISIANQRLLKAAKKTDLSEVIECIKEGADVNVRDNILNTPLILVSSKKCVKTDLPCADQTAKIATLLLENGADADLENRQKSNALYLAVRNCNIPLVEVLVKHGASLEKEGSSVFSLVNYSRNNLSFEAAAEMIKYLSGLGMNLDIKSGYETPLIYALKITKDTNMAIALLDAGADPLFENEYGQTALMWAACFNDSKVLQRMLSDCRPEDLISNKKNAAMPIHGAASFGYYKNVKLLLEAGSEVDPKEKPGRTPLFFTAFNKYPFALKDYINTASILIDAGADINAADDRGDTVLNAAAEYGYPEFMELLINKGAEVNHKNRLGITALYTLAFRGHTKAIETMCRTDANLNEIFDGGRTAVSVALISCNFDSALALISCGADVSIADKNGETPLFHAASRSAEVVRKLIEHKADVNVRSVRNETPVMVSKNADIAEMLIEAGADIKAPDGIRILCHAANKQGFAGVIKKLMDNGIDADTCCLHDTTPLMMAEDIAVAEVLLKAGADINLIDRFGQTALFHAAVKSHSAPTSAIVKTLIEKGADVNIMSYHKQPLLMVTENTDVIKMLIRPLAKLGVAPLILLD